MLGRACSQVLCAHKGGGQVLVGCAGIAETCAVQCSAGVPTCKPSAGLRETTEASVNLACIADVGGVRVGRRRHTADLGSWPRWICVRGERPNQHVLRPREPDATTSLFTRMQISQRQRHVAHRLAGSLTTLITLEMKACAKSPDRASLRGGETHHLHQQI